MLKYHEKAQFAFNYVNIGGMMEKREKKSQKQGKNSSCYNGE